MKKTTTIAVVLAIGALAAATDAAGSRPSAGDWSGTVATKPVTFVVTAAGRKRFVSNFQNTGTIKAPCAGALPTSVSIPPKTAVTSAGTFKERTSIDNGFGAESWTVSGKFKGGRASGTVAIVLAITATKRCDFTVKWSARFDAPAAPKAGAKYSGKETNSGGSVTLKVSANGKTLESVRWGQPLVGNCPGVGTAEPYYTAHNVQIHGSKFSYTLHTGKISHGSGTTGTNVISGEFVAGHQVAGTVSTSADISGIGVTCVGQDTWTAKG